MKHPQSATMTQQFIQRMEHRIISGQLAPGQRLPNERELAAEMKVSRTIINSGIRELARKGFVRVQPRQGTFVEDFLRRGNVETLSSLLHFSGGKLDRRTFDSLAEFRIHSEAECARLAALRRTEEDLDALRACCEEIRDAATDEARVAPNVEYHRRMFLATQNTIYPLVFNAFGEIITEWSALLFRYMPVEEILSALEATTDAIERHSADEAAECMRSYANRCVELLDGKYPAD